MPAVTVEDITILPRIPVPDPATSTQRPVRSVTGSEVQRNGGWR